MQSYSEKILFISWKNHRRSEELCKYFSFPYYFLQSSRNRIARYVTHLWETFFILARTRPRILIVQNPSIVLSVFVTCIRPLFRYKLIVDAHNGAILPDAEFSEKIIWLYRYVQRKADLTIVTNKYLAEIVSRNNGQAFVLQDAVPQIHDTSLHPVDFSHRRNVVYICSFCNDEPYTEVLRACAKLPDDIGLYITGKVSDALKEYCLSLNNRVKFTGFLDDYDYFSLLKSADLIIDLTIRDNCLVCAAYEAVSVGTPILLADTKALKEYFTKGCVFTSCFEDNILHGIMYGLQNSNTLKSEIVDLRQDLFNDWTREGDKFIKTLHSLS